MMIRLSLFISKTGYCSRRKADALIAAGKVTVNDKVIFEPFFRVAPSDVVTVEDKLIDSKPYLYLAFHKPKGVTTTLGDDHAKQAVSDFLRKKFKGVYPVGRLDRQSSGLLILTNDGELCYRLTHPKFLVEKEYEVRLTGFPSPEIIKKAQSGMRLEGENLKIDRAVVVCRNKNSTVYHVVVHEGKKRHLRRLFKALGFPVTALKRIRIGRLFLGALKPGKHRPIKRKVIYSLFF